MPWLPRRTVVPRRGRLPAHETRIPGPPGHGDREGDRPERWWEDRCQSERQQERREGEEDVGHAHDDLVHQAAVVPRDDPEGDAHPARDRQDEERDHRRDPGAEQHARVQVATQLVGPEPVGRGGREQRLEWIGSVRSGRRETPAPTGRPPQSRAPSTGRSRGAGSRGDPRPITPNTLSVSTVVRTSAPLLM